MSNSSETRGIDISNLYLGLVSLLAGVTASIGGGDLKFARRESILFVILLGLFSLKMLFDDYIHFSKIKRELKKASTGIFCSLLMWLLLCTSFSMSVTNIRLAVFLLLLVMLIGACWIATNYLGHEEADSMTSNRHMGWFLFNIIFAAVLSGYLAFRLDEFPLVSQLVFSLLSCLVGFDAWKYRTLERLSESVFSR